MRYVDAFGPVMPEPQSTKSVIGWPARTRVLAKPELPNWCSAGLSTTTGISISAYTALTASHTLDTGAATVVTLARGRSVIRVPVSGLLKIAACFGAVFSADVPELAQAAANISGTKFLINVSSAGASAFVRMGADIEDAGWTGV